MRSHRMSGPSCEARSAFISYPINRQRTPNSFTKSLDCDLTSKRNMPLHEFTASIPANTRSATAAFSTRSRTETIHANSRLYGNGMFDVLEPFAVVLSCEFSADWVRRQRLHYPRQSHRSHQTQDLPRSISGRHTVMRIVVCHDLLRLAMDGVVDIQTKRARACGIWVNDALAEETFNGTI
jgi:hypothetical protein